MTVDWTQIHHRLEKAKERLDQRWKADLEGKRTILRERARAFAQESKKEGPEDEMEVLEFMLAYERYGIEPSHIREVCLLKDLTPLPGTPPFISGIINVRGKVLSVIDLKKLFDLPEKGLGDLNKVIVLSSAGTELGVLADAILGIKRTRIGDLQPSLPTLTGIREAYLKGVTGDRLIVLDAEKILSDKKIVINESV